MIASQDKYLDHPEVHGKTEKSCSQIELKLSLWKANEESENEIGIEVLYLWLHSGNSRQLVIHAKLAGVN